jgi:hypothetical protein
MNEDVTKPMGCRPKSPREKKALSYVCDRRNDYGENDKASRKNIPRAKARSHRLVRRADRTALRDLEAALEIVPLKRAKPAWKKTPDITLGLLLRRQRWRAAALEARQRGEPQPERSNFYDD